MPARSALPRPGPRWGPYPTRPDASQGDRPTRLWPNDAWHAALPVLHRRRHSAWLREVAALTARHTAQADAPTPTADWPRMLAHTRRALRAQGFSPGACAQSMVCVRLALAHTGGPAPHPLQMLAASHLLDQQLVEMATGEGKTLAMALAACIAAMAGVPVHVITANDYLAERDAHALEPLAERLGLRVGHLAPDMPPAQRREVYGRDIVFTAAREPAFDHLRDELALPGSGHETPVLRGLCMALLDEADSILLDEAVVPLVISGAIAEKPAQQAARRALWWQARQVALALQPGTHFEHLPGLPQVRLTAAGLAEAQRLSLPLGGPWRRPGVRQELLRLALTAQHALHRDRHYLVREQRIELLDQLTGRIATGRNWTQGLQALVELKEGCPPSAPSDTLAQITYQRFFQRYWHLAGLSGTLIEARAELREVYGLRVRRMPLRQPCRRVDGRVRVFGSAEARWQAAATTAAALRAQGRPVLIGTDTVSDSERLSWHLNRLGIPHAVLNARHDRHEAGIVSQAGRAGQVTVATRMAGRGTDIVPDAAALAAGGLHVIHCQRNESRRMDRQLLGRAGRHGQPGSTETWICSANSSDPPPISDRMLTRCSSSATTPVFRVTTWWRHITERLHQWLEEQRQSAMRRHLLKQDRQWEARSRQARR